MENWRKVSFSAIKKAIDENEKIQTVIKTFHYLPAILVYGVSTILLLKLSQVILGWHF